MAGIINPKHQVKRVIGKSRRTKHAIKRRLSVGNNYYFSIDSPRKTNLDSRTIQVEGWIIPKDNKTYKLRVKNNGKTYEVSSGLKRLDVAKAHPEKDQVKALHSGFSVEFEFEDGEITVELNNGKGFKKLYTTLVSYSSEALPKDLYNKNLSNNYPEHINLLNNRQKLYYEDRIDGMYTRHDNDARLMAIYLPQFHPFAENDKAWGRGFTEWTNVATGQPRFVGHQQPILPKDLGFYDLRLESKIKEQIDLAKKYGVYGFCIYYYWFSGKKLMEGPIETIVAHKEWDFNFAICWANENWTKRWDGRDNDVIIAQEYRDEDPLAFIMDVEHIITDTRYIEEDGKPVLMVYRASELKDPAKYAEVWRDYFKKKYGKELQLVSYLSFDDRDPREYGFDAALDFAPLSAFFKTQQFENNQFPYLDVAQKLIDPNFSGIVADYRTIAQNEKLNNVYDFPVYPCLTPSWDNDARKKGKGFIYQNSSPDLYADWLDRLVRDEQLRKDSPLIFINAWNEWAEGAIMEPSMHLGHAVLNRTVEVLAKNSYAPSNISEFPLYGLSKNNDTKLAVVLHLYYTDLWPSIREKLSNIVVPFDLFVTLNERDKDFDFAMDYMKTNISVFIVPNRGRDVLPFLHVFRRIEELNYEYILKIHSKKSKHRVDGGSWFQDVLDGLLPDKKTVKSIISSLQKPQTGIISANGHLVSLKRHMGSNEQILKHMLQRAYGKPTAESILNASDKYTFVGGTMFWARTDAIKDVLKLQLMADDFQSEHGQIDGTTAHSIERFLGICVRHKGRKIYQIEGCEILESMQESSEKKYEYAP